MRIIISFAVLFILFVSACTHSKPRVAIKRQKPAIEKKISKSDEIKIHIQALKSSDYDKIKRAITYLSEHDTFNDLLNEDEQRCMAKNLIRNLQWISVCDSNHRGFNVYGNAEKTIQNYYLKRDGFLYPFYKADIKGITAYFSAIERLLVSIGKSATVEIVDALDRGAEKIHHKNVVWQSAKETSVCTVLKIEKYPIAKVLSIIGGENAVPVIAGLLDFDSDMSSDELINTSIIVCEALGNTGNKHAVPYLLKIHRTIDIYIVQEAIAKALENILISSNSESNVNATINDLNKKFSNKHSKHGHVAELIKLLNNISN